MKFYCEHCLRFDKDYVNSLAGNFYEECEDYLNKINIDMRNMRVNVKLI